MKIPMHILEFKGNSFFKSPTLLHVMCEVS